jgi:hypothetical protein
MPLRRGMTRFPFSQRGLITFECLIVQIEHTGGAAAMAAIVEFRALRWRRARLVEQWLLTGGFGHGSVRMT